MAWVWLFLSLVAGMAFGQSADSSARLRLIAFGDVNLGRTVGQRLFRGYVDYPFEKIRDRLSQADIVFVNLESQLSDRGGETESPTSNVIFCGPPVGAASLRRAQINVVSTANNHAFDYGIGALRETITYLRSEGIHYAGTSADSTTAFEPTIIETKGVRVGVVAYTQLVNVKTGWEGYISLYDSQRAKAEIEDLVKKVDFVVASYHGGKEYVDDPDEKTRAEMRSLVDYGADIVLGHHPHVPQGIEEYKNRLIFHSLGNFVFYQSPYWTRRSFGIEVQLEKSAKGTQVAAVQIVPVLAGYQPSADLSHEEVSRLIKRIESLSNIPITSADSLYFVQISSFTSSK